MRASIAAADSMLVGIVLASAAAVDAFVAPLPPLPPVHTSGASPLAVSSAPNSRSEQAHPRHLAPSRASHRSSLAAPLQQSASSAEEGEDDASSDSSSSSSSSDNNSSGDGSIDVDADPRLVRVRLPRATTIEWGTDLSFAFVYVRALEPAGAADLSGAVAVGDQLCELRPVVEGGAGTGGGEPINLIGAPFDTVMSAFAALDRTVREVDLVFFRGTKDELKELCAGDGAAGDGNSDTITITVVQNKGGGKKGDSKDQETVRTITAPAGCNVRQVLVDHGINVYQSVTRWTNCKGKQLCGTCIVNVSDGAPNTNRKSMDEASTLRENPEGYRLSCVTFAYGDVTVETFPPIKAAQWTR